MLEQKKHGDFIYYPLFIFNGTLYYGYSDSDYIRIARCEKTENGDYNIEKYRDVLSIVLTHLKNSINQSIKTDYYPSTQLYRIGNREVTEGSYKAYMCNRFFNYFEDKRDNIVTKIRRMNKIHTKEWTYISDFLRRYVSIIVTSLINEKTA